MLSVNACKWLSMLRFSFVGIPTGDSLISDFVKSRNMRNPLDTCPGLKLSPAYLLKTAASLIDERYEEHLKSYCGDGKNFEILLAASSGTLNQATIADTLDLSPNEMVDRIDSLEQQGYVRRVKNPENRKENLVHLTEASINFISQWEGNYNEHVSEIFSCLSNLELDTLKHLCTKLIEGTS